jgi:hypothetical protein
MFLFRYMYLSSTDRVIRAKRGTSGIHVMKTVQAVIICQYEVMAGISGSGR